MVRVDPADVIAPYDVTFKKMAAQWQLDNLRCRGRGSGDFIGTETKACQRETPFFIV
jgi:hypothetical protein